MTKINGVERLDGRGIKAVEKSKRLECVYCKSITPLKWVKRNRGRQ